MTHAACAVMILSAACGAKYADSEYLGTWEAATTSMSGISLDVSKTEGEFSLTLSGDGSVKAAIGENTEKGKWEETDRGFLVLKSIPDLKNNKKDTDS
jgi:hypothetical protein